jgi:hypothetical protein
MSTRRLSKALLPTLLAAIALLTVPTALAATPRVIIPPGFNCASYTMVPHSSGHIPDTVTVVGESYGCTAVVSSLTLRVDLVHGSSASDYIIAWSQSTWYNTSGPPGALLLNASDACSAFGSGYYSAKTTGSFVYNGATGAVQESQRQGAWVTC